MFETYATAYARSGRPAEAGAFKRAARLSLAALRRFVRDDGSLYVVKNRYPAEARHGYETVLVALAVQPAGGDACWPPPIAPRTTRSRSGRARRTWAAPSLVLPGFHKVFAAAGGTFVEYDTFGDPKFNPTGLLRVHVAGGNPQLGPSDGVAAPGLVALGTAWRDAGGQWHRLGGLRVGGRVEILEESPQRVRFRVVYEGMSGGPARIEQAISVEPEGVTIEDRGHGAAHGAAGRAAGADVGRRRDDRHRPRGRDRPPLAARRVEPGHAPVARRHLPAHGRDARPPERPGRGAGGRGLR